MPAPAPFDVISSRPYVTTLRPPVLPEEPCRLPDGGGPAAAWRWCGPRRGSASLEMQTSGPEGPPRSVSESEAPRPPTAPGGEAQDWRPREGADPLRPRPGLARRPEAAAFSFSSLRPGSFLFSDHSTPSPHALGELCTTTVLCCARGSLEENTQNGKTARWPKLLLPASVAVTALGVWRVPCSVNIFGLQKTLLIPCPLSRL